MGPGHRGRCGHPPGEKTMSITYPSVNTGNPAPDGTEGNVALGGQAPLHAPRSARDVGSTVPHPTRSDPGGSGPGIVVTSLLL